MFGKGGGPLNAWIKEFCELVFIQTLQAFIFALVNGFIVKIITYQHVKEQSDNNAALGIICIVALTSIFKIEDIARRIFGYGPTKADHGNAVQSIGKSMMALKMGKNLLDNGKKVVGGAGAFFGAHGQRIKAQKRMQSRLNALDKDNNGDYDGTGSALPAGDANNTNATNNDLAAQKQKLLQQAKEKRNEAINKRQEVQDIRNGKKSKMSKSERNNAIAKLESGALNADKAARNLEEQAAMIGDVNIGESGSVGVPAQANNNVSSKSKGSGGRIKDYNQKKLQIQEEFDNKKAEIKKNKRQGLKQLVSGVAESGAALVGFTAGTAMSVASTNDWGGALKDGITWAGTADAVTAGAVDLGFSAEQFIEDRVKNAGKLVGEYGENVAKAYKDYVKDMETADQQIAGDIQGQVDDINKSAEKAAKTATSKSTASTKTSASVQNKKWTPSTKKGAVVGALAKGFKNTAINHSVKAQQKIIDDTIARLDKMNSPVKASDTDRNILN